MRSKSGVQQQTYCFCETDFSQYPSLCKTAPQPRIGTCNTFPEVFPKHSHLLTVKKGRNCSCINARMPKLPSATLSIHPSRQRSRHGPWKHVLRVLKLNPSLKIKGLSQNHASASQMHQGHAFSKMYTTWCRSGPWVRR